MRVFVYDRSGFPLLSQGFLSSKSVDKRGYETLSGSVDITAGTYGVLSYNFDAEDTHVDGENSFQSVYAYTDKLPESFFARFGSRADGLGDVYYTPDHLMVAGNPQFTVKASTGLELDMDAHTVVDTYYIQIRVSGQASLASNANGVAVLSGLSKAVMMGEGKLVEEPVSVYFEMKKSVDPKIKAENQHVLCAVFNTFGRIEDIESSLKLTLSVLARNGKTFQKEVDMTPIFKTEDARLRHWLLIDEVWEIPEVMDSSGGGFRPEVEGWEDIEQTIPL